MQSRGQRQLYEELELIDRQAPESKTSKLRRLFDSLQAKCHSAIAFLTQESEPEIAQESEPQDNSTDFAYWYINSWQAGHYALMNLGLSSEEDVRNWLEAKYQRQSKSNPWITW